MKVKHSVNSLNFNWFQAIPVVLPESIRQDVLDTVNNKDLNWRAYSEKASDHPSDFINRGRRCLLLYEMDQGDKILDWFESTEFFISLKRLALRRNYTNIPSLIMVMFHSHAKALGIQKHTDPVCPESGWKQLRFNFMLQNALDGGQPIIGDQLLEVPDGHGWYLFATDQNHRALPVKGHQERSILSLAYYIDPAHIPEAKQILTSIIK